jgi:hypothetical protein
LRSITHSDYSYRNMDESYRRRIPPKVDAGLVSLTWEERGGDRQN